PALCQSLKTHQSYDFHFIETFWIPSVSNFFFDLSSYNNLYCFVCIFKRKCREFDSQEPLSDETLTFKGSFCRSKDHLDDSASSTETSHVTLPTRGNVELGVPGTWPSLPLPPFSVYVKCYITQLLKGSIIVPLIIVGIDFESTSSIIGAIYALTSINKVNYSIILLLNSGVGVNTHVEQTDGVAAALGENTNVNHQISSSVVPDEGVQHQTIRFLTQRMERRRHGWIGST
ncbi:BnaCnng67360D, partial [Brassica napus]